MKPDDIAAIRPLVPLFRWARANGYHHTTYQVNNGPVEHVWRTRNAADHVSWFIDTLTYEQHGFQRLWTCPENPRQLVQLLAVYGIGVAT